MPRADTRQALEKVLRHPAIWRAEQVAHGTPGIPTAYPALDQVLPERGWPVGTLTELLVKAAGAGELSLLMPALRAVCAEGRGIALVAPPWLPHARAWEAAGIPLERMLIVDSEGIDLLWAAEQILRSSECGAVLVWGQAAGRALNNRALQRLHLAANTGNAACFLYRSVGVEASPSPAPLRIRLAPQAGMLQIQIVKSRGAIHAKPVQVQLFPAHWDLSSAQACAKTPLAAVASHGNTIDAKASLSEAAYVAKTSSSEAAHVSDATCLHPLPEKVPAGSRQIAASSERNANPANSMPQPTSVADAPFLIPVQLDLV